MVRRLPLGRLHLETDAPWCEVKRTHASHPLAHAAPSVAGAPPAVDPRKHAPGDGRRVKGRCEPGDIVAVAAVVAALHGVSAADVAAAAEANAQRLFWGGAAAGRGGGCRVSGAAP